MGTQLGELQHDLVAFARIHTLPDYVKQADVVDCFHPETLGAHAYADRVQKRFPVHTKAATYCSWLRFLRARDQMPATTRRRIGECFEKAAAYWDVADDLKLAERQFEDTRRPTTTTSDDDYAIVYRTADGTSERHYRMKSAEEVRAAADALLKWRDQFSLQDRQTIARRILKKAAQYEVTFDEDLTETLDKIAGRGFYEPQKCAAAIRRRLRLVKDSAGPELVAALTKAADTVERNPTLAISEQAKEALAKTIEVFDHTMELTPLYSRSLPRPEDVVYGVTYRPAEEFQKAAVELVTGHVYHADQLKKLSLGDVRDVLGDDIADAVSSGIGIDPEKFAEVASTFPRREAEALENLLREAGEAPLLKHAHQAQFTNEELAAWADLLRQTSR